MDPEKTLRILIRTGNVDNIWRSSNQKSEEVSDLQMILNELGFGQELSWDKFGADGLYGQATMRAVKDFCLCNKLESDGQFVSLETAKRMLYLYELLDEIKQLKSDILQEKIAHKYKLKSPEKTAVASLQSLLNDLGFGEEMQWSRYRNDGIYGNGTMKAVQALSRRFEQEETGEILSDFLAAKIIDHYNVFLGSQWSITVQAGRTVAPTLEEADNENPLVTFKGSHFVGRKLTAERDFIPELEKMNDFAKESRVKIWVTSSFRTSTNVIGAIVTPAKRSNHLVGHAIDMNLLYGDNFEHICNSAALDDEENWPDQVHSFIEKIREDGVLRWGGDFRRKDSVHIDDNINNREPETWQAKYEAIWAYRNQ